MSVGDKVREAVARLYARQAFAPDHRVRRAFAPSPALEVFPPAPPWVEPTLRQAIADMADKDYCKSIPYSAQLLRADITGADPTIVDFSRLLVKRLRVLDVPMFSYCVWRSKADQDAAFARGVSKVKYPDSAHNWGCAVDIIHGQKGWNLTPKQWSVVGHIGFEIATQNKFDLVWGGDDPGVDDKFNWDPAHWELLNWRAYKRAPR